MHQKTTFTCLAGATLVVTNLHGERLLDTNFTKASSQHFLQRSLTCKFTRCGTWGPSLQAQTSASTAELQERLGYTTALIQHVAAGRQRAIIELG